MENKTKKDGIKVNGQYRCTVKRADGRIEQGEWKNTISSDLLTALKESLGAAQNYALDALFDGNVTPPTEMEDGIIVYDNVGADWYEMDCSIANGSPTYSKKITGVFTGFDVTLSNAKIGFNFGLPSSFGVEMATPTSWSNIKLAAADELTIEWTISFS